VIIADYSMIGELMNLDADNKFTLGIADRMRCGKTLFLMEDNARACVTYEPLTCGKRWMAHILSAKDFRGEELWNFSLSTAVWMVDERAMRHMLCFIANENRVLRMFVRYFRMKSAAVIGEDSLYVASAEQIKKFASEKEK
jgi:hypothetical protein